MILQGESYEFGTVFQTVAFFIFVIPRLPSRVTLATLGTVFQTDFIALLARCFLDVAFWMLLFWLVACWQYWQSTKQQNHKTTRQQK